MSYDIIKSWGKINLSLNVIKRLNSNYHAIESLITFVSIYDEIKIKITNQKINKIYFKGKFSNGIVKENTISKLFNLLEKNKLIKNKKFSVKIKKNIPQKSGMGGGSMNAASVLSYLINKQIISISSKKLEKLVYQVGSDTILGLEKKNSILLKNGKVKRLNCKLNFHVLIVMPNFGCSTQDIFSRVKKFSKPSYFTKNISLFKTENLVKSKNDLENIVTNKYLKIKKLKYFLSRLPNALFVRMTGSGSALVCYFRTKKAAKKASKIFREKYKSYWFIVSKTI